MTSHDRPLIFALAFALTACASVQKGEGEPQWLEPSPQLAQKIEDQVRRLPWTHGEQRVELIHWFASIGEPAYARLLVLCLDPRPEVASSAVAALGASGDSRLVEPLNDLDWPEALQPSVRYERARALLRLGDWSQMDALVDGLEDESLWTRAWCAKALEEVTRQRLGYDPQGSEPERAEAVQRWRDWMSSREGEGILVSQNRDAR
jgi:HEAT repeat protein